ncbi:hypothetical protein DPMN_046391 [Dreissena polymorpha]|uniref:Uncharacterized protein n=1 Tax=Dreissena polymorpha TaxID=45954 RepID=A0A9D4D7S3_DREPO|nr:hypothetical protein DPMN_046391 [Dreissena polymorpha]
MTVYSSRHYGIIRAKNLIETTIKEEWTISNTIHINTLDDTQMKELKGEAKINNVFIIHDRTLKTVQLVGFTSNVLTVNTTLHSMLSTVTKHLHEQEKAELLQKVKSGQISATLPSIFTNKRKQSFCKRYMSVQISAPLPSIFTNKRKQSFCKRYKSGQISATLPSNFTNKRKQSFCKR